MKHGITSEVLSVLRERRGESPTLLVRPHTDITMTTILHKLYTSFTRALHELYTSFTQALHKLYTSFTQALQECNVYIPPHTDIWSTVHNKLSTSNVIGLL